LLSLQRLVWEGIMTKARIAKVKLQAELNMKRALTLAVQLMPLDTPNAVIYLLANRFLDEAFRLKMSIKTGE
jgi:hypothetical protein